MEKAQLQSDKPIYIYINSRGPILKVVAAVCFPGNRTAPFPPELGGLKGEALSLQAPAKGRVAAKCAH